MTTTTHTDVTTEVRREILGHLAKGRAPAFAATVTRTPADVVEAIAAAAGWPDATSVYKAWVDLKRDQEATDRAKPRFPAPPEPSLLSAVPQTRQVQTPPHPSSRNRRSQP